MDYLTKNPFPKLQLVNIKQVYSRKLSQLDQRFLEQNENEQQQTNNKEQKPEKENSQEDFEQKEKKIVKDEAKKDQKTAEQIKKEDQVFREERKKQYKKIDKIDINKKIQYFSIQKSAHCDPYLRKHFISEKYEIYRGFNAQETIPKAVQEKCYNLRHTCCSSQEMDYLDKRAFDMMQKLQNQRKFLKKILIKIRSLSYIDLTKEFKQRSNQFKGCMKGDPYRFDLSLKDLFNYLYDFEDEYENYVDFLTHRIYDFSCSFCNAEDTDFFLFSHQRNMYVNTIKAPEAILAFYNMYNKVQHFYKLYAFTNLMYCFRKNKYFQDYIKRDLDFQNRQDVEKFQKIDKNYLLKDEELMSYFTDNYFPGILYVPNFESILKVLKLALDEQDTQTEDEQMNEHQIETYEFFYIDYVLKTQTQKEDFAISNKRQIILLNAEDGFFERKVQYDPKKFPNFDEKAYIYMMTFLTFLVYLF